MFDLMTLNTVLRAALGSGTISSSLTFDNLNYSVFHAKTLCHAVTLTFDLLTLTCIALQMSYV